MKNYQKYSKFITHDIWDLQIKDFSNKQAFFIKFLRVSILTFRSFTRDKCYLQASALTFYTIMSIVPIFAMIFGVANGFGLEKDLESQLLESFANHKEVIDNLMDFAKSMLEKTNGGMIAGIGVFFLFWSVIKVLGNIEKVFNDIWGVKQHRQLIQKFNIYLSVMVICPFVLIIHSGLNGLTITISELILKKLNLIFGAENIVGSLVLFGIKFLPYLFICLVLSFLYLAIPNIKVKIKYAVISGIIAGVLFQLLQVAYIVFQVTLAKQNEIYGAFAAFPLFLIWLQLSWLIVLFGAEISFACQNIVDFEFNLDSKKVSHKFKRILSIQICQLIVQDFATCAKEHSTQSISHTLKIPIRLTREIINELYEAKLIVEIKTDDDRDFFYHPAIPIDKLTILYIYEQLDNVGLDKLPVLESLEYSNIVNIIDNFNKEIKGSKSNILLTDLGN